jgi:hypothetical protein
MDLETRKHELIADRERSRLWVHEHDPAWYASHTNDVHFADQRFLVHVQKALTIAELESPIF